MTSLSNDLPDYDQVETQLDRYKTMQRVVEGSPVQIPPMAAISATTGVASGSYRPRAADSGTSREGPLTLKKAAVRYCLQTVLRACFVAAVRPAQICGVAGLCRGTRVVVGEDTTTLAASRTSSAVEVISMGCRYIASSASCNEC